MMKKQWGEMLILMMIKTWAWNCWRFLKEWGIVCTNYYYYFGRLDVLGVDVVEEKDSIVQNVVGKKHQ